MYASSIKMYKSNRMGSYYKVRLWESLTCRQFGRQFIGDEVRQDVLCRDALHLKKIYGIRYLRRTRTFRYSISLSVKYLGNSKETSD